MLSFSLLPARAANSLEELRQLILEADARRASQLLVELCAEFPLAAGILTLMRQGSINQAIHNISKFDQSLAADLRLHIATLNKIHQELQRPHPFVYGPTANCRQCGLPHPHAVHIPLFG